MTASAAAKASNRVSVGGKDVGHHTHGMLDLQPQSVAH